MRALALERPGADIKPVFNGAGIDAGISTVKQNAVCAAVQTSSGGRTITIADRTREQCGNAGVRGLPRRVGRLTVAVYFTKPEASQSDYYAERVACGV
jgi:hypothetical protein